MKWIDRSVTWKSASESQGRIWTWSAYPENRCTYNVPCGSTTNLRGCHASTMSPLRYLWELTSRFAWDLRLLLSGHDSLIWSRQIYRSSVMHRAILQSTGHNIPGIIMSMESAEATFISKSTNIIHQQRHWWDWRNDVLALFCDKVSTSWTGDLAKLRSKREITTLVLVIVKIGM